MNKDIKFIIRGALLALMVVITISAVQYYFPANLFAGKEVAVANHSKKNSIPAITNIQGQHLFNENCTSCHRLYGRVDGPTILGVENRVKDKNLLREWIRNSSKVIQSGNPYFTNLINEYGVMMPDFPQLTDAQIDAILTYLKEVEVQQKTLQ